MSKVKQLYGFFLPRYIQLFEMGTCSSMWSQHLIGTQHRLKTIYLLVENLKKKIEKKRVYFNVSIHMVSVWLNSNKMWNITLKNGNNLVLHMKFCIFHVFFFLNKRKRDLDGTIPFEGHLWSLVATIGWRSSLTISSTLPSHLIVRCGADTYWSQGFPTLLYPSEDLPSISEKCERQRLVFTI